MGRLGELLRGLQLTVGGDDLGPPLPLGLRLAGHRPLHLDGHADVTDLDPVDLDPPRRRLGVQRDLQLGVDAVALLQQLVELMAADDRPQGGLGDELRRAVPVANLDDRGRGVDDLEERDRVDGCGDVVLGDDGLRGDRHGDDLEVGADEPVDDRDDEEHSRALRALRATEPEDHPPLVLLDDLDRGGQEDQTEDDDDGDDGDERIHEWQDLLGHGWGRPGAPGGGQTSTVVPWNPTTVTGSPGVRSNAWAAAAFHRDPSIRTTPVVRSHRSTAAV